MYYSGLYGETPSPSGESISQTIRGRAIATSCCKCAARIHQAPYRRLRTKKTNVTSLKIAYDDDLYACIHIFIQTRFLNIYKEHFKLQNLQRKKQELNYGNYTYNKTKYIFWYFRNFEKEKRMYFGIWALFCTINRYFEYRIRTLCI